jgi:hypothetical protein
VSATRCPRAYRGGITPCKWSPRGSTHWATAKSTLPEINTQVHLGSSTLASIAVAVSDIPRDSAQAKVESQSTTHFLEVLRPDGSKSLDSHKWQITFALKAQFGGSIQPALGVSAVVEPPANRARRTDSAAMYEKMKVRSHPRHRNHQKIHETANARNPDAKLPTMLKTEAATMSEETIVDDAHVRRTDIKAAEKKVDRESAHPKVGIAIGSGTE